MRNPRALDSSRIAPEPVSRVFSLWRIAMRRKMFLVPMLVLLAGTASAEASTLEPELVLDVSKQVPRPADLAVDGAGNMFVLGRDSKAQQFKICKYSPSGAPVAIFGSEDLSAAFRIAVTSEGRVVVADHCHPPGCTAGLVVFSPSGQRERFVAVPYDTAISQLTSLGGEAVGMAFVVNSQGFHPFYQRLDASSGEITATAPDFLALAGADKLNLQWYAEEGNRLRDYFIHGIPGQGKVVAGWSGKNAVVVLDDAGRFIREIPLAARRPQPLSPSLRAEEQDVQEHLRSGGVLYNTEDFEGLFLGLSSDLEGNIVVTGRGKTAQGQYTSEVYTVEGRALPPLSSPYELNRTLRFANGKAYAIVDTGSKHWSLVRFRVR